MIKGGYTSVDFSSVRVSEDPVTINGIYQKIKDTFGKPIIVNMMDNNRCWGFPVDGDGSYVILVNIPDESGLIPAYYVITNEDAVSIIVIEANEG